MDRLERLEQTAALLAQQLKQAERNLSGLKWIFFGMILVIGVAVTLAVQAGIIRLDELGASVSKTVNSQEYGLHNREGKRVVLSDYDKFGYPSLVFMDINLNYKMGLKVWPLPGGEGMPSLVFYDGSGLRGNFRMEEQGEIVVNLLGQKGKGGITMKVTEDGNPSMKFTDKSGKVLFEAPTPTN
ncbi:hypothetical protein ACYOEI_09105 [Singulisphaera rosea]